MLQKEKRQYRLPGYDYSNFGVYFVTVKSKYAIPFFGAAKDGKMVPNYIGEIVIDTWCKIPEQFNNVKLDIYQLMPDHIHGLIEICKISTNHHINSFPIKNNPMLAENVTLGKIIRWFKGRTKYEIGKINNQFQWLPKYHDRIIRDETELFIIQNYIKNNAEVLSGLKDETALWELF